MSLEFQCAETSENTVIQIEMLFRYYAIKSRTNSYHIISKVSYLKSCLIVLVQVLVFKATTMFEIEEKQDFHNFQTTHDRNQNQNFCFYRDIHDVGIL